MSDTDTQTQADANPIGLTLEECEARFRTELKWKDQAVVVDAFHKWMGGQTCPILGEREDGSWISGYFRSDVDRFVAQANRPGAFSGHDDSPNWD